MDKKHQTRLWVYSTSNIFYAQGARTKTHIVDEESGRPLCGSSVQGTETLVEATWEWLHQPDPDGEICSKCRKAGILKLRPKAEYWYLDPVNGNRKTFTTLKKACDAAKKEHREAAIYQLGPGDINRLAMSINVAPPLP